MGGRTSVLLCEHDRHYAAGEGRAGGIWREVQEVGVVVVDLEEDHLVADRDGPEVVLAIGVIVRGERVKAGNRLIDLEDGVGAKCLDGAGDDDSSSAVVF